MTTFSAPVTPVILSGGSGTRLWPMSRSGRPKQFLDITGAGVMLDQTLARCADRDLFTQPVIVASARGQATPMASPWATRSIIRAWAPALLRCPAMTVRAMTAV